MPHFMTVIVYRYYTNSFDMFFFLLFGLQCILRCPVCAAIRQRTGGPFCGHSVIMWTSADREAEMT